MITEPEPDALRDPGKAVAETSHPEVPEMAWVVLTVPLLPVHVDESVPFISIVRPVAPALVVVLKTTRMVLSVPVFIRANCIYVLVKVAAEDTADKNAILAKTSTAAAKTSFNLLNFCLIINIFPFFIAFTLMFRIWGSTFFVNSNHCKINN